ncbi:MAG: glycosyltransferase [Candidatus Latescibacteria bacterium]|nr:glycosyltransferase [bacterium]MBD3425140.1 glycosyltransferase [Candidatus Latescibacterota bacterium]
MRIALLGDGSLPHVRRWGEYFRGRGYRVELFTFEETPETGFPVTWLHRHLPTNLLGYLSSLPRLKSELRRFEPDIINALYISGYGLLGALSGYQPLVLSALGSDLLIDYRKHFIHRAQIHYAIGRAGLITVDSESLIPPALEAGARREDIIKVYFGIDRDTFHPSDQRPENGPLRIISTRNLYPVYNLDLLIEAAPRIAGSIDAEFVICGEGPERERLEQRIAELQLAGRFSFEGRLSPEELSGRLRSSHIYVSTSTSDSTSVSLLEAMACGAYPVVTGIEANREWIENGVNGTILKENDPEELAGAVISAAVDRELISAATARNLEIIEERALWEKNMEKAELRMLKLPGIG